MIILDTNVISEAMRGAKADPRVIAWIRGLTEVPVTTVINRAEILAGIAVLPDGHRRDALSQAANGAFATLGACLPLAPECAVEYADIVTHRRRTGHPIGGMDALIAAIARVSNAVIATRDSTDFEDLGIGLVNPWN